MRTITFLISEHEGIHIGHITPWSTERKETSQPNNHRSSPLSSWPSARELHHLPACLVSHFKEWKQWWKCDITAWCGLASPSAFSSVPSPASKHPVLHHRHLICLYTMKARAQSAPMQPWRGDSDTPTVTIKDIYGQHYVPIPHSVSNEVQGNVEMYLIRRENLED